MKDKEKQIEEMAKDIQTLKDRISELEKENSKLKQFPERLKEKLEESNCINNGLWLVDTQVLIDETLKEIINKGDDKQ